jgi:anti-anti-sigma factor
VSSHLAVEHLDGTVLVCPIGELDLASAPELERVLEALITESSAVIVELSGLTFVDCAGLRPIQHAVRQAGSLAQVRLSGASPVVRRVLELCGLARNLVPSG